MTETDSPEAIIPLIYDAALDRSLWPEVLKRFAGIIGAHCGMLVRQNVASGAGQSITFGCYPTVGEDYFGYFAGRNVLLQKMGRPRPGLVSADHDLLAKRELRKSEYYNDFLRAKLDADAVLNGCLSLDGSEVVAINFCRPLRGGQVDVEDKRRLELLVPHFQRAFALSLRLGTLENEVSRDRSVLDRAAHAILLLDDAGRVLYANAAAEHLLAAGDGVFVRGGGISAAIAHQTGRLAATIRRAAQDNEGAAVRIDRPRGGRPLYALVAPLSPDSPWMQPGGGRMLLLLRDPEPQPVLSARHLSALFGLTPAEARVALHLYQGEDLASIAAACGISRHTVRVHVNAALRKTGSRRQADLIRQLTLLAELADHRRSINDGRGSAD